MDSREPMLFTEGFVPGSINIGLSGRFAEWAGSLLPFDKPIVLVTDAGKEKETVVRMARVGFAQIQGCLDGGFATWKKAGEPVDMIINIEPDELALDLPYDDKLLVIDVRREAEFADGHIQGAVNLPLNELTDPGTVARIEEDLNVYVHCASGYRSIIACSLIKRQGLHNIRNIVGGWNLIKDLSSIQIEKENSVLN